ncbi:MAG: membrane protein [Microgenomates group bacterium GW2011_GWC1_43_13]|nr:MAG: membrane protein [Microgenomates group bacterium GW2011_GWC1_43_13]
MRGSSEAVYGLGFIGALIYFIQNAHSFGEGLLGILKAIVWPALVVYKLLGFLKL